MGHLDRESISVEVYVMQNIQETGVKNADSGLDWNSSSPICASHFTNVKLSGTPIIHCCVTNYPKCNDLEYQPFYYVLAYIKSLGMVHLVETSVLHDIN